MNNTPPSTKSDKSFSFSKLKTSLRRSSKLPLPNDAPSDGRKSLDNSMSTPNPATKPAVPASAPTSPSKIPVFRRASSSSVDLSPMQRPGRSNSVSATPESKAKLTKAPPSRAGTPTKAATPSRPPSRAGAATTPVRPPSRAAAATTTTTTPARPPSRAGSVTSARPPSRAGSVTPARTSSQGSTPARPPSRAGAAPPAARPPSRAGTAPATTSATPAKATTPSKPSKPSKPSTAAATPAKPRVSSSTFSLGRSRKDSKASISSQSAAQAVVSAGAVAATPATDFDPFSDVHDADAKSKKSWSIRNPIKGVLRKTSSRLSLASNGSGGKQAHRSTEDVTTATAVSSEHVKSSSESTGIDTPPPVYTQAPEAPPAIDDDSKTIAFALFQSLKPALAVTAAPSTPPSEPKETVEPTDDGARLEAPPINLEASQNSFDWEHVDPEPTPVRAVRSTLSIFDHAAAQAAVAATTAEPESAPAVPPPVPSIVEPETHEEPVSRDVEPVAPSLNHLNTSHLRGEVSILSPILESPLSPREEERVPSPLAGHGAFSAAQPEPVSDKSAAPAPAPFVVDFLTRYRSQEALGTPQAAPAEEASTPVSPPPGLAPEIEVPPAPAAVSETGIMPARAASPPADAVTPSIVVSTPPSVPAPLAEPSAPSNNTLSVSTFEDIDASTMLQASPTDGFVYLSSPAGEVDESKDTKAEVPAVAAAPVSPSPPPSPPLPAVPEVVLAQIEEVALDAKSIQEKEEIREEVDSEESDEEPDIEFDPITIAVPDSPPSPSLALILEDEEPEDSDADKSAEIDLAPEQSIEAKEESRAEQTEQSQAEDMEQSRAEAMEESTVIIVNGETLTVAHPPSPKVGVKELVEEDVPLEAMDGSTVIVPLAEPKAEAPIGAPVVETVLDKSTPVVPPVEETPKPTVTVRPIEAMDESMVIIPQTLAPVPPVIEEPILPVAEVVEPIPKRDLDADETRVQPTPPAQEQPQLVEEQPDIRSTEKQEQTEPVKEIEVEVQPTKVDSERVTSAPSSPASPALVLREVTPEATLAESEFIDVAAELALHENEEESFSLDAEPPALASAQPTLVEEPKSAPVPRSVIIAVEELPQVSSAPRPPTPLSVEVPPAPSSREASPPPSPRPLATSLAPRSLSPPPILREATSSNLDAIEAGVATRPLPPPEPSTAADEATSDSLDQPSAPTGVPADPDANRAASNPAGGASGSSKTPAKRHKRLVPSSGKAKIAANTAWLIGACVVIGLGVMVGQVRSYRQVFEGVLRRKL